MKVVYFLQRGSCDELSAAVTHTCTFQFSATRTCAILPTFKRTHTYIDLHQLRVITMKSLENGTKSVQKCARTSHSRKRSAHTHIASTSATHTLNFCILFRCFLVHTAENGQDFIWVQMVYFTTPMNLLLKTNLNFVLTPMKRRRALIANTTLVITTTT